MNKIKVYNNPYIKEHASEIDFFKSHFIDAFANNDTTQEHRAFQPCENSKIFNDKLDGTSERPGDGESAFSWRGKPLPYMPSPYQHPDYWNMFKIAGKRRGDIIASLNLHNLAEEKHPVTEDIRIPVEKINGYLILAGAKDDVMWDTSRGILRMKKKLEESEHSCELEVLIYDHCSHLIFPESMVKLLMPGFLVDMILPRIYRETKGFAKECRRSRIDLDEHIQSKFREWIKL